MYIPWEVERGFLLPNHGSLHAEIPSHVIFCILSLLAPIAFLLMVFLAYSALYSAKYNGPIEPNKKKKTKEKGAHQKTIGEAGKTQSSFAREKF